MDVLQMVILRLFCKGLQTACVEFHNKIVKGTKQDPVSFSVASGSQRDSNPKTFPQCKRMAKTV